MYKSVMVIEDSETERYIISRILVQNNFSKEIIKFADVYSALKYLQNSVIRETIPQVIFVDIHMPLLTGFDFLSYYDGLGEEIKSNSKVYILSATCDENDISRVSEDKNVSGFIQKPLTRDSLKSIRPSKAQGSKSYFLNM